MGQWSDTEGKRVEFRVLGPVEVVGSTGSARPRGDRQRTLLAALLMRADQVVPVEYLLDAVWGEDLPATGASAVYTLMSRLRQVLGAAEPGADQRLVSAVAGYRLQVEPGELDLAVFRDHVRRGRIAATEDRPLEAARELHAGLALWRGQALEGVSGDFADPHVFRLREEHLIATEERIDADLSTGKQTELVSELRALIAGHPLRERLHGQLMVALFRAGQQVEALQAFQDAHRTLVDELGIEPGHELLELQHRILQGDPDLYARPVRREIWLRRNDLPGDIADFTGRESELRQLLCTVSPGETAMVVSSIDGMAGVGKTALAVHAAHRLADRYPDAQLFVDLHAHTDGHDPTDPGDALGALLGAMGIPADRIPEQVAARAALWRAELANRRVLVVLDNAVGAAQVRPLLPGTAGCLVLITSRRRLVDLDSTRTVTLGELPPDEAVDMFTRVVGDARPAVEADAAREVVRLCGYLPLAIRIAAARLASRATWSIAYLAQRLREGREFAAGDRSVAAAFELSYRQLTADQQRVFRLMSLHAGGDFDAHLTAAAAGTDPDKAGCLLEDLVDVHLLLQPAPGRFGFHDLLRRHAQASTEDSETDRHDTVTRLLDYHLHTAGLAIRQMHGSGYRVDVDVTSPPIHVPTLDSYDTAVRWLETERGNLTAAITFAAEHGRHTHVWQISQALWYFFLIRGHFRDWVGTHRLALTAAQQLDDPAAEAETRYNLGTAYWRLGSVEDALEHLDRAMAMYRAAGDRCGEGKTHNRYGLINEQIGRPDEARECYERALPLLRETSDRWTECITLTNLAGTYALTGKQDQALDCYHEALDLAAEIDERWVDSCARAHLGTFYRQLGRYAESLEHHRRALALKREIGDRGGESDLLSDLGDTHLAEGRTKQALAMYEQALTHAVEILDRQQQARAHDGLAAARSSR